MDAELAAAEILQARRAGRCLDAATLPIDDRMAYAVQALLTDRRLASGERQVGWKLGYTSDAMRAQMGIDSPNLGPLTDAMLVADGGVLPEAIQPRVEPEIALVIGEQVSRSLGVRACRDVTRSAHLALEVVDSIWCDYRFDWAHNTADGSSAAYVVLGPQLNVDDLAGVEVTLARNGEPMGSGIGAAAMGDPYAALSWLTGQLTDRARSLHPGDIVITGGLCAAVSLHLGDEVRGQAPSLGLEVCVRR